MWAALAAAVAVRLLYPVRHAHQEAVAVPGAAYALPLFVFPIWPAFPARFGYRWALAASVALVLPGLPRLRETTVIPALEHFLAGRDRVPLF